MTPHCSSTRRPTTAGALSAPPAGPRPPAEWPQPADPAKPPPGPDETATARSTLGARQDGPSPAQPGGC
jgi:hypothetical protein